jgi:hypothetical protein
VFGDAKMTTALLDRLTIRYSMQAWQNSGGLYCKGHIAHPDPDNRGKVGDDAEVHLVPDVDQAQIGAGAIGQRPRSSRTAMRGGRPRLSGQYPVRPAP